MKKTNQKKIYTGILNVPRKGWRAATLLFKGETAAQEEIDVEIKERIEALYKHYNLPYCPPLSNMMYGHQLAMCLAKDHVLGFSTEKDNNKHKGRVPLWSGIRGVEFYFRVELKKRQKSISTREALVHVAKDMDIEGNIKNLNSRYHGDLLKDNKYLPVFKNLMINVAQNAGYSDIQDGMIELMITELQNSTD